MFVHIIEKYVWLFPYFITWKESYTSFIQSSKLFFNPLIGISPFYYASYRQVKCLECLEKGLYSLLSCWMWMKKKQSLFFQSNCTLTKYVKSHNVISFLFGQTKHFGIQGYTCQLSM